MILGIVTGISAVFLILSWILIFRLKSLQSYKNSRLHHRIKNDLQLLVSILNIQGALASDSSGDGSVEKNLSKAASRVAVMALIHQAMQKSSKPGFFDGSFFARELCKSLSGRYPGSSRNLFNILCFSSCVLANTSFLSAWSKSV